MSHGANSRGFLSDGVLRRLAQIRLSRIILFVLFLLIVVPLVTHYYLSGVDTGQDVDIHRTRARLEALEDFTTIRASDLKSRIEELLRIKGSVSMELRDLEAKRGRLQQEISTLSHKIDELKAGVAHQQMELDRVKISVQQAQVAHREAIQHNTPELAPPRRLLPSTPPQNFPAISTPFPCTMATCWDYSRCSITSGFPVYFYQELEWEAEGFLSTTMVQVLGYNPHIVHDPNIACAYLVLLGELNHAANLTTYLKGLKYWGGDGRNHLLLQLVRTGASRPDDVLLGVETGRAVVLRSTFPRTAFRSRFDVVVPPLLGPPGGDIWQFAPSMLPSRRKYLASYQGQAPKEADADVIKRLQAFVGATGDLFLFDFSCPLSGNDGNETLSDWSLCGSESLRTLVLRDSTFVLILAPPSHFISTAGLQTRMFEALRSGAIPVIVGGDEVRLSYDEVLAWRRATILLPTARVPELHFLLRSISDADILSMRRQGRLLWEAYMSTIQAQVDTALSIIRDRIGIPALPARPEPSPSLFNSSFQPLKSVMVSPESEPEESLGPLEPPYASPSFLRNYTISLTQGFEVWNEWAIPFWLYPHTPFDPVLPSDAKFTGSATGFRPIGRGAGGAGKEFSESLGGNHPREQFTIVMLTYEREQVLINSLSRLHGLPYLNKVVVVWNSPRPPLEDLRWPDIGVPVHVVRAKRNSLNNRFLPYDAIETEAVLSVDDDAHLRHDEIMFGFRVWRERRDRIVGFPGRYHAWDLDHGGWLYNSNYSCELSMVLTGAAFFHKYYMNLYTYWLPQAIRDKVDEYMNCEDIAINFLVSHWTREPPVKVTSRWTFRCPGCPVSLSEDDTHFQERHKCIQFFTQVFGYTPLLSTQFRADSILFKTRIPHDKQKCFKFI